MKSQTITLSNLGDGIGVRMRKICAFDDPDRSGDPVLHHFAKFHDH